MRAGMRWGVAVAVLLAAPAGAQDAGMGAAVFQRCAMCHEIGEGAVIGLPLWSGAPTGVAT